MTETELRELDAEIAVKVMGWQWFRNKQSGLCCPQPPNADGWHRSPWGEGIYELLYEVPPKEQWYHDWDNSGVREVRRGCYRHGVPRYSTDIAAAWEVVKVMCGPDYRTCKVTYTAGSVLCWFFTVHAGTALGGASAEDAPLAICLAALKALNGVKTNA